MNIRISIIGCLFLFVAQSSIAQDSLNLQDPAVMANNKLLEVYASHFGKSGHSLESNSFAPKPSSDSDFVLEKNYIIQLGAFKKPNMDILNRLQQYGTLYTEQKGNLTVFKLGFFLSELRAEEVLGLAENEGFSGAFINEINVRKKKPVETPKVDSLSQDTIYSPAQTQEIANYFKRSIKRDLTFIKDELAQTGRYRINKIIRLLKVPLDSTEKQRFAESPENFYPGKNALSRVYSYRTVPIILFKSKFNNTRNIGPILEANVIDLEYSDKGYSPAVSAELKQQVADLKAMIQQNDNKGLKLNQILDKALKLDNLINQL